MAERSGGGFLERTRWQSSPPASTLRHQISPTVVEQRRTLPPPRARGRGTGGQLDSSPVKTHAAARRAARGPSHGRGPPLPLLAVAGTNRQSGCARGCSKPLEPLVCLGEVCFSLFSAEEVFCRCRTAICCGQSKARSCARSVRQPLRH
jgi:hypothetical protein